MERGAPVDPMIGTSCNREASPVLFRVLRETSGFALVLATAFEPTGCADRIATSIAADKKIHKTRRRGSKEQE
jgi:hypothetical protein